METHFLETYTVFVMRDLLSMVRYLVKTGGVGVVQRQAVHIADIMKTNADLNIV